MADQPSVLSVSIVTPSGRVYENDHATMVIVTTKSGQLGIMPNHIPTIASLEVDEARVEHDGKEDEITVNGGFVEFSNNMATIVADSAELSSDIDIARAQSAQARAEAAMKAAQESHDADALARAQVALRRAINRINVAKH